MIRPVSDVLVGCAGWTTGNITVHPAFILVAVGVNSHWIAIQNFYFRINIRRVALKLPAASV